MNNWKEVPHLFANGKFKLKELKFHPDKVYDIEGYNSTFKGGCFLYNDGCLINTKYCTLIARRIEDMTDDEINKSPNGEFIEDYKWAKDLLKRRSKEQGSIPSDVFLYLLSIGVYPFDQSHFETGEVLDINKL